MAIFHFSAKVVSRGKGQSSVAKAAYNARTQLTNERTGEEHDYTRAEGLVFSGIFAPKNAPEWAQDRERLWSEVEQAEKRKDAQLAREIEIALPYELTDEQRRQLITDFTRENFVRKGMIADVAIHAPDREGDDRNHHAHILLTMREIGPEGFGKKKREWNSKAQLQEWREKWEKTANRYLERHGHEARIDHRSLEDQGIEREATEHLGPTASQLEREGEQTERGDINREIEARNRERERLKIALRATSLELAGAERAKAEEWEWAKIKPKTRAPYSRAGMVAQQQDAQRDFEKRSKKLQERQAEERKREQQTQQREKNPFAGRKSEAEQKREDLAARRERTDAKAEITEAQRARMERDALREKAGLRVSSGRDRDDGRERERERD
ncbi:MAG: MobA/MobL family protein [Solidesulfovibrio magneticus str. Maddingley MBC34]|uniref:MobA/MobL family protein n=1 Tax=Solidesulfovibrio magneticus str. Maddingley MBC34 TaxID=1206767 RepID=K6GRC0_9BACT|nr:MAG: MobA/MobL family protein [Solidesulfovibrio magneticus str. Maddingley MBC34]